MTNLATSFATVAQKAPDKIALYYGEDGYSYGQYLSQTHWVAQTLQTAKGVHPGERVGLWLKNCPEFIPALFGVLQADAVVVPINNFLKPDEVNFILADAEINVIITDNSMAEHFAKLAAARPGLKMILVEEIPKSGFNEETLSPIRQKDDLAVLIYTSGTTGHPKGAMLSHNNLLHNVESCRRVLDTVADDRIAVLLPMFHSFMLCVGLLLPLLVGGSILLVKSLHPPKNIVQEIIQRRATILPSVPPLFRALVHPSVPVELPLRLCISGGAPLPGEILREFSAKFPVPLIEGYGLSEASPVVTFNPINKQKAGSIGQAIYDVEVSIQNEAGEMLPIGETGELCVRGGNVMLGYWKQPTETAKAIRNGWLLTGDIGHQDWENYFFITDRKKDMLLVNGINVYPREIEEIIYQFPGVKEAAVIGVPDTRKGELPVAFVSANEGITLDEKAIQQFIREKLADYKVPRSITVLPALPRNATGKILKTALRQLQNTA